MKASKNILVITILTLAFFSCKKEVQPEIKIVTTSTEIKSQLDPNATYAMAEFTVEGMTCQIGCANSIQKKLAKMEGVKSAKVDFESKMAMVEFDDSKQNLNSIETAVTNVSEVYTVKNIKTLNVNEAKGNNTHTCEVNCTKACCKTKSKANKKACSEDCKKACCVSKV